MVNDNSTSSDLLNEELKGVKEKCLTFLTSQWELCFTKPFSQELEAVINDLSVRNQILLDPYYFSYLDYQENCITIDKIALDELLLENNVDFLYGCYPTEVLKADDGRLCGVIFTNRAVQTQNIFRPAPRALRQVIDVLRDMHEV